MKIIADVWFGVLLVHQAPALMRGSFGSMALGEGRKGLGGGEEGAVGMLWEASIESCHMTSTFSRS